MTQQQMTRDLAEKVMGWNNSGLEGVAGSVLFDRGFAGGVWVGAEYKAAHNITWNPFTSRDDAHELLAKLTEEQWRKFSRAIQNIWVDAEEPYGDHIRLALMSTPAQITEAVWRATCQ